MHSRVQVGCLEECGSRAVAPSVQASVYKSLVDVATGMQYLHNLGIVHGALLTLDWLSFTASSGSVQPPLADDHGRQSETVNPFLPHANLSSSVRQAAWLCTGDLKPANVLLKSTVSDSRGFICKCAPRLQQ